MAEEDIGQDTHLIPQRSHESEPLAEGPATKEDSPTTFVWALTVVAGISGLLFGYE